jgi:hypothetical protein
MGRGGIGLAAALLVGLLAASEAAASETPVSCSTAIFDPAPGYRGPLLHGFGCDYLPEAPQVTWTVPAEVAEVTFYVYGADRPLAHGQVRATLAVTPGEALTLEMGHEGSASRVLRAGVPILVASGGNGEEPNYIDPGAWEPSYTSSGGPLPPDPRDGRVFVDWLSGFVEVPGDRCVVPRLKGLRPVTARRRLIASGCTVGTITRRPSRRVRRGRVVGQSEPAGIRLPGRQPVGFAVGRGPRTAQAAAYSGGTPR